MIFRKNTNFVRPFLFPTQTILVDDDESYLNNFCLNLPLDMLCYVFTSPVKALSYIQEYDRTPLASFSLGQDCKNIGNIRANQFSLNYKKVLNELSQARRFNEIAVAVVDYAMPKINGLKLCSYFSDHVKRIMLTGMADQQTAIDAFNKGLIHKFMLKNDSNAVNNIIHYILNYQTDYFAATSYRINDYLGRDHLLNNKDFVDYFNRFVTGNRIIEYYLIAPNRFLAMNKSGHTYLVKVETDDSLTRHHLIAKRQYAPDELLKILEDKTFVPHFPTKDFHYAHNKVGNWQDFLYEYEEVNGDSGTCYCAVIKSPWLPELEKLSLYSYQQFRTENPDGFVNTN